MMKFIRTAMSTCFLALLISGLDTSIQEFTNTAGKNALAASERILFVLSNAHYYGNSEIESTNHFPEIVHAYDVFAKAGLSIDFVSPDGGRVALGYIGSSDSLLQSYLFDCDFMGEFLTTLQPSDVESSKYKAVYYPGGGSAMTGVPSNTSIQEISRQIYEENGGIVSAVCHGTAGIANIKLRNGDFLVNGKRITGFPDLFENKKRAYYKEFPFSIEEQIRKHGGDFSYSESGWDGYIQVDGRILTGQDPSGSASVARELVNLLKERHQN